jgi:hypothetical protein
VVLTQNVCARSLGDAGKAAARVRWVMDRATVALGTGHVDARGEPVVWGLTEGKEMICVVAKRPFY